MIDESKGTEHPSTDPGTEVASAELAGNENEADTGAGSVPSATDGESPSTASSDTQVSVEPQESDVKVEDSEDGGDSEIRPEDLADDDDDIEDEFEGHAEPIEEAVDESAKEDEREWFILKVQSNREKSICDALRRRVAVQGLDDQFGEILVPTEDVAEFKNGTRRVVKRKLYPGYIVANMVLNDETWFLVRETPGIGDFTGAAGKPTPMLSEEVDRIVKSVHPEDEDAEQIKTAIPFSPGDRVRIKEGTFENFEGEVEEIDEANGRVTVTINIFGRSTPVELEHWQIENV